MLEIPTILSYSNVSLKSDGNPEMELVGDEMLKCVRWTVIRLWVSIFLTGCIACNMELVGMEMILHPGGRSHLDNIVLILIWKQYRTHQTCVNQSNEYHHSWLLHTWQQGFCYKRAGNMRQKCIVTILNDISIKLHLPPPSFLSALSRCWFVPKKFPKSSL